MPQDAPLTVGKAFAMQGAQARVILYSNVLSPGDATGFVDRPILLNVAVSRAQDYFLFFGDMSTIVSQRKSRALGLLAEHLLRSEDNRLDDVPISFYGKDAIVEHVATHERHRAIFQEACQTARSVLLVGSPSLGEEAINVDGVLSGLRSGTGRGVQIEILSDSKLVKRQSIGKELAATGARVRFIKGIHAKTLAMDDALLYEGSGLEQRRTASITARNAVGLCVGHERLKPSVLCASTSPCRWSRVANLIFRASNVIVLGLGTPAASGPTACWGSRSAR
jgi:hypothetical protein